MLTVYGASDDLVEFEGDFEEEFPYDDSSPGFLVLNNRGEQLIVRPKLGMVWLFELRAAPKHKVPNWQIWTQQRPSGDYGDMQLVIDVPGTVSVYQLR